MQQRLSLLVECGYETESEVTELNLLPTPFTMICKQKLFCIAIFSVESGFEEGKPFEKYLRNGVHSASGYHLIY